MEFDWEKFLKAYQEADEKIKGLIDSEIIADFVQNEISKGSLLPENRQIVIVALSHYSLKATPENEIIEILTTHGVQDASSLFRDFNFIYIDGKPSTNSPPPHASLASEITTTEKELASIQTVRTMSHDMAAIKPGSDVVYQSSQADILAKNEAPLPPITATAPDVTRWDTDTRSQ